MSVEIRRKLDGSVGTRRIGRVRGERTNVKEWCDGFGTFYNWSLLRRSEIPNQALLEVVVLLIRFWITQALRGLVEMGGSSYRRHQSLTRG